MSDLTANLAWLANLVGEWTYEFRTADDSDHPGATASGTEAVRRVGDNFLIVENVGKSDDGSASHTITLIGYEPEKGRFSGAVAGTAVPVLFVYNGEISPDGRSLVLETEGPAMTQGRDIDRYRDVFQFSDSDHRFTAAEVFADGEWREFMRTDFVRVR